MKLLFLTQYDESGASSRICIYQFLDKFKESGFECTVRPLLTREIGQKLSRDFVKSKNPVQLLLPLFLLARTLVKRLKDVLDADKFDLVIVQKDVLPGILGRILRWKQKKIIFHIDDPIWLPQPGTASHVAILGPLILSLRTRALIKMLKASQLTIVDNPEEKKWVEQYCKRAIVITAPIDTSVYLPRPEKKQGLPVFGWIGSPSTWYLMEDLIISLETLALKNPFELHCVGGFSVTTRNFKTKNIPWTLENEKNALKEFDIGLLPLDSREFNKTKFSLKGVLYFTAAIPTLATDVGLNRQFIQDAGVGLLYPPGDREKFQEEALRLLTNPQLRKELGSKGRQKVESEYALEKCAQIFINSVKDVIKNS